MCLGVPGQVLEIAAGDTGLPMGKVSFGGVVKEVCLAYVPEVTVGEYVIVHVGFAISIVSESEAAETFELLQRMGELAELEDGGRAGVAPAEAAAPTQAAGAPGPPKADGPGPGEGRG